MLVKQALLLAAAFALRPGATVPAQILTVLTAGWRVAALTLMLAFVPPYSPTSAADLRALGTVVVVLQIIAALGLLSMVVIRFSSVAQFVAAAAPCCAAGSPAVDEQPLSKGISSKRRSRLSLASKAGVNSSVVPKRQRSASTLAINSNPVQRHAQAQEKCRSAPETLEAPEQSLSPHGYFATQTTEGRLFMPGNRRRAARLFPSSRSRPEAATQQALGADSLMSFRRAALRIRQPLPVRAASLPTSPANEAAAAGPSSRVSAADAGKLLSTAPPDALWRTRTPTLRGQLNPMLKPERLTTSPRAEE